ncbi:hypothetical protein C8A00DRAFT_39271 [Chaetomidium leptoderma]|uniref:C2H2-type domain-containing protein n=1 Tax=Chaetomidium leptoderma TaxID=669021 RepID=A0AAN6VW67_9PEZI|nr:hypothetical protein C8A00DRAFT_39271 [Chaetomidium leptoderma]
MTTSDLNLLLEMGFEQARAELAVKKTGGLQQALNWLEENQDKPLEELQASQTAAGTAEGDEEGAASMPSGEGALSLVCNECGKKFRNHDQASFHASKTDHTDFSESTEEIAPLTEEEKKARLEDLRQKLKEKRATQSVTEKEEAKRNEQIRMKASKESQDVKEELQRKEQIKEAAKKRQEKLDDLEAKKRIKARIEADRAERKRREEDAKAMRAGKPLPSQAAAPAAPPAPVASASGSSAATARLRLQTKSGNLVKSYPSETTLFEVAQQIEAEVGAPINSFTMTFPKKTFEAGVDFGQTLKEAGLAPTLNSSIESPNGLLPAPIPGLPHPRRKPRILQYRGVSDSINSDLAASCRSAKRPVPVPNPPVAAQSNGYRPPSDSRIAHMASHLRNLSTRAFSQPGIAFRNTTALLLPTYPPLAQRNTMATSEAPKKMEWLVVIPDFPGANQKRLEVRPKHFAGLAPAKESGLYQMGGAVLNDVPTSDDPSTFSFAGSTIVIQASSRDEIKEVLRKDIYANTGVWDVENAQMWPLLCAFRQQK